MNAKILLVDDAEDIRTVLEEWLRFSGYQVDAAPGVTEAMALIKQRGYDVVITDLVMPGLSGHHLLDMVKEYDGSIEVIFLTGQGTLDDAVAALREGRAFDFLQKPVRSPRQLNETIERALARRRGPADKALAILAEDLTEREILLLVGQGMENREIADRLCLSEKTIKNNMTRIFDKLGVENRTQAALYCQQHRMP